CLYRRKLSSKTRAFFCEEDIIQLAIRWKNRAASLCIFYCNSLHFLLAKNIHTEKFTRFDIHTT
ncbi:hypothetical protein, partial [Parageobacillus thermoglucosidasius]|uniref:hypothetical protein n=1 Tax=Parageobacillus thermoglucosidasius TaxID=1426 RepID=UPI002E1B69F6|nr:hypothetical protein [Parageobacillus thermoglucosidasius]MED4984119.1 hypothetical protein [Parageobacillus thermoglucosidasius]